jgi:hypothetical protein
MRLCGKARRASLAFPGSKPAHPHLKIPMNMTHDPQAAPVAAPQPVDGRLMALSLFARLICVLLGTVVIFRFFFEWTFMPTMLAGGCALVAALIPPSARGARDRRSLIIILLSVLGLLFQAADIVVYYVQNDFNGKHYWWSGAYAYFTGLTLMAVYGAITLYLQGRPAATDA